MTDGRRPTTSPVEVGADQALVEVGEVVGTHGLRGELRIRLFNPESEILSGLVRVFLLGRGQRDERVERGIVSARAHGNVWLLRFEGVASIEEATSLVRRRLAVPMSTLPELGEREFYHYQLIGLSVVDESGTPLGEVAEILSAAGNDVLAIRSPHGERLVPIQEESVREVDLVARRIVVRPLPGLFD